MLIASNHRRSNRHGPNRTAAQRCATDTAVPKQSSHPILQAGNPVLSQQRQAFRQFCCATGRVRTAGPSCPDTSRLTSTSLRLERIVSSRALAPPDRERRSNPLRGSGASRRRTRSPDSCPLSTAPGLDDRPGRPAERVRPRPTNRSCPTGGCSAPGLHRSRALNSSRRTGLLC